jgi:hypothetical protein
MQPISQTKFLSENYGALHGLNAVPIGLALFLVSLWANLVHYPVRSLLPPVVMAVVLLLLSVLVDRYYKRTYGQVRPVSAQRRRNLLLQVAAGTLGLAAFLADVSLHLPVSFIGLLFVAMFLFDKPPVRFPLNRFSAVRLVSAVLILLVSLLPLLLGRDWWSALGVRSAIVGVTMFVGLLMVLQGLLWHIFFVRALPAAEVGDE